MTVARAAIAVALGCIVPLLLAASTARALNGGGQEPRTVLRYSACGGLINQQYSHISAFTLALALGAEVRGLVAAVLAAQGVCQHHASLTASRAGGAAMFLVQGLVRSAFQRAR